MQTKHKHINLHKHLQWALLLFCWLAGWQAGWGQYYRLEYDVEITYADLGSTLYSLDMKYITSTGISGIIKSWNVNSGLRKTSTGYIQIPPDQGNISTITLVSKSEWDDCEESESILYNSPCFDASSLDVNRFDGACLSYKRIFRTLRYYPVFEENCQPIFSNNDPSISVSQQTQVSIQTAFPANLCNWQFSINQGATWIDFPPSLQGKKQTSFSGKDIFAQTGLNINDYINKNILLRISAGSRQDNLGASHYTIATILASPPAISVQPINPTCPNTNGSLKVSLSDRNLDAGEKLHLEVYNVTDTKNYQASEDLISTQISTSQPHTFNLPAGTYFIKYQSHYYKSNGEYTPTIDKKTIDYTIDNPTAVTFTADPSPVQCSGGTGSITLQAKDGTAPYSYTVDGGNQGKLTDQNATAIISVGAGKHTVTISDSNNCTASPQEVTVNDTDPIKASITNVARLLCKGDNSAYIVVNVSGRTTYNYKLYKEGTPYMSGTLVTGDNKLSPLPAGNYSVDVSAGSCNVNWEKGIMDHTSISISDPAEVTASIVKAMDVTCQNYNDGKISVNAQGGSSQFTYTLTGDNSVSRSGNLPTENTLSSLPPGSYKVEIFDTNNCRATWNGSINHTAVVIKEPSKVTVSISNKKDITCHDDNDGTITLQAGGGTENNYQYAIWTQYINESNNWIPFSNQTTTQITKRTQGDYKIKIQDGNQCVSSITDAIHITNPDALSISTAHQHPSSYGNNDGSITISVQGGTAPYKYTWTKDDVAFTSTPTLSAGIYTVTVTDSHQCSSKATDTLKNPVPPIELSATSKDVTCYGGANGSIVVTPSRTPDLPVSVTYYYSWKKDGKELSNLKENASDTLSKGTYSITVTDNQGAAAKEIIVTLNERYTQIIPSPSATDVTCHGKNDGSVTIASVSGGAGGYSYLWENGSSATSRSDLAPGTYQVTITDSANCTTSASATIAEPNELTVSLIPAHPTGYNTHTGTITATCHGGNEGSHAYKWQGSSSQTNIAANLPAGNYSVEVTDSKRCSANASVTLTEPAPLTVSIAVVDSVSCNGYPDGSLKASATGGVLKAGGYTYTWKKVTGTGETTLFCETKATSSLPGLGKGTYKVLVEDAYNNDLLSDNTITLSEPDTLRASSTVTPVKCFGQSNGVITLYPSGGNGGYTFLCGTDPVSVSNPISGLAAGSYQITIKDRKGCFIRSAIEVSQPNKLLTALIKTAELSAYHASDGKISATTSGGTLPYAFLWQGAGTPSDTLTSDVSGLSSGSYSLMVRDANLCAASASTQLIDPMRVIISVKDSIPCYNQTGALTAHAVGGVPFASGLPYRYDWYKKNSLAYQSIFQNDSSAINLSYGEYMVKVRDAADSIRYQTFTLVQPDPLMAPFAQKNISCNGFNDGSIRLQPSGGNGGYRFLWQDNGETLSLRTDLAPGQYTAFVSDRKGCVTSPEKTTVSITQPDKLVLELQKTEVGLHCGGTIDAMATGGTLPYLFSWSNAAPVPQSSQSNLCAGSYPVVVTDANACTASALTYLPPPLIASISILDSVNCFGQSNGTLRAHVIGGVPFSVGMPYTYRWSKKNSSGSYQVLPGYSDSIAPSLSSGWYALNVTDKIGKTLVADSLFFLPQPSPLAIRVQKNDVLCYGGKTGAISALVSGGLLPYRLLWNTGDTVPDLQNIGAGNYSVQVYDRHGCYKQYEAIINQSDSIIVGFSATVAPSSASACDGSLHANVMGGIPPYAYRWNNGASASTASGLCAGDFSVAVTDLFGCPASGTKRLSDQSVPLSASLSIRDSVRCYGFSTGAIRAKVAGGVPFSSGKPYRYIWKKKNSDGDYRSVPNSNDSILSSVSAGWYSLQVMDAQNSVLDNPVEIFLPQPDSLEVVVSHSDITCHGLDNGTILATVTGGVLPYLYQWSNNVPVTDSSLGHLSPGNYTLSVSDKNGCSSTHQVSIREPEVLTVSIQASPISEYNAANGILTAIPSGGTAPFTFAWKDTALVSASMERLAPGAYSVAVTDANGCRASQSASLVNPPPLRVVLSVKDSINCFSWSTGSLRAAAAGGVPFASAQKYRFIWKKKDTAGAWQLLPGYTDSIASGLNAGVYACNITDAYGAVLHADSLIVLPQPSELNLVTAKSDIGCSGKDEGTASAALSGGVPPYSYAWNTGETTAAISGLPAGPYMVRALDSKGCVASRQMIISKAEPLYMSLFSSQPLCYNDCNGSILSHVSGGVQPYSYQWTGVNASADQTDKLCAGAYALKVVDAAGCSIIKKDTLLNPARLPLSLGANRYICHGQTLRYDISIPGATDISYAWTGSNGFSAASPIVELTREGTYRASVTDSKGCLRTEEITLLPSRTTVENEFVVPTQAFVNEGIVVVNTTYPVPDSIRWVLPSGAIVANENQSYAEFYMPQTGSFTIRMISYKGECSSEVDKVLLVSEPSQPSPVSSSNNPFIQSFVSAPNPNHGVFQVKVVLQDKADIQIKLINIANNQVVYQVRKTGEASYQLPVNVALPIGSYLILLETPKGSASIKAIIF